MATQVALSTHACTNTPTYAHPHAHTHIRTPTCAHPHTHTHMRTPTCAHPHAHTNMRTPTCAHTLLTRTRAQTHTHTGMRTHTHLALLQSPAAAPHSAGSCRRWTKAPPPDSRAAAPRNPLHLQRLASRSWAPCSQQMNRHTGPRTQCGPRRGRGGAGRVRFGVVG